MEPELRGPTDPEFVCRRNNLKCAFTTLLGHLHLPAKPKLSLPYFKASCIHTELSKKQFKAGAWLRGKLRWLSWAVWIPPAFPLHYRPSQRCCSSRENLSSCGCESSANSPSMRCCKEITASHNQKPVLLFCFYTSPIYQIHSRQHSIRKLHNCTMWGKYVLAQFTTKDKQVEDEILLH